ncbi:hypothetical protein AMJ50_01350 [Parcubacteria bacterium DG_74_3]|nr:MAG: hypothetical protein AMJ50_01350 [Parcubacteria bacterium DG_74_3]
MEKLKTYLIPLTILFVSLVIAVALFFVNQKEAQGPASESTGILSSQQVAQMAIDYINQNLLTQGLIASLVDVKEENGVYKIHLKIGEEEYDSYVTKDGKILFPEGYDLEGASETQPESQEEQVYTIGNFLVSKDETCKENEKPAIYFFGSEGCPHCQWEHPIVEDVTGKFEEQISFHNNMDSGEDMDIFKKYSSGGIPTLVLGCKYSRVGSGARLGEEGEEEVLTALICSLTGGQPADICNEVRSLIDQI